MFLLFPTISAAGFVGQLWECKTYVLRTWCSQLCEAFGNIASMLTIKQISPLVFMISLLLDAIQMPKKKEQKARPDFEHSKSQSLVQCEMPQVIHCKVQFMSLWRLLERCPIDPRVEDQGIQVRGGQTSHASGHRTQVREFAGGRGSVQLGIWEKVRNVLVLFRFCFRDFEKPSLRDLN